jgi:hypothetical protein
LHKAIEPNPGQVFWLRTVLPSPQAGEAKGVSPSRGNSKPQWDATRFPIHYSGASAAEFNRLPVARIADESANRAGMDAARGQEGDYPRREGVKRGVKKKVRRV